MELNEQRWHAVPQRDIDNRVVLFRRDERSKTYAWYSFCIVRFGISQLGVFDNGCPGSLKGWQGTTVRPAKCFPSLG
jgi:hypothetical protein